MSRAFLVLALLLLSVGCHSYKPPTWESPMTGFRTVSPGIVVVATANQPQCTGFVLANARGNAYIATAAHCATSAASLSIGRPEETNGVILWRHTPVSRVCASSAEDVAILETPTDPLLTLPLATAETVAALPIGTPLTLPSYFDTDYRALSPHEYSFAWGRWSDSVFQQGHSGAPALYHGEVVALFTGATSQAAFIGLGHKPLSLSFAPAGRLMDPLAGPGCGVGWRLVER